MSDACYETLNGILHIEDQELGISYKDTFVLGPSIQQCIDGLFPSYTIEKKIIQKRLCFEQVTINSLLNGEQCSYRFDGTLSSSAWYRDNALHGPSKNFYPNQTLASLCYFISGKRAGKALFFDTYGNTSHILSFKDGEFHGLQRYFYPDRLIKCEIPYLHGQIHGKICLYFPNGEIQREIVCERGKRHGLDTMWDQEGIIRFTHEYEGGKFVKGHIHDPIALAYRLEKT